MTPEQLLDLLDSLKVSSGDYGRMHDEPPDYEEVWWIDGQCRPAELARKITQFFQEKPDAQVSA